MTYIITGAAFNKSLKQKDKKHYEDDSRDDNFAMDNYNSGMVFGTPSELIAMRVNKVEERKYERSCDYLENEKLEFKRSFARQKYQMETQQDRLNAVGEKSYTYLEPFHYQRLEYLYNIGKLKLDENPGGNKGLSRPQSSKLIAEKARSLRMSPMYKRPSASRASTASTKLRKESRASILRIQPSDTSINQGDDNNDHNTFVLQSNRSMALRITTVDGYQKSTPLQLEHHIPHALLIQNPNLTQSYNSYTIPEPRPITEKSTMTSPFVSNVNNYKHQYNLRIPSHTRKVSTTSTDLFPEKAFSSATSFSTVGAPRSSIKPQKPHSAQQQLNARISRFNMNRPATSMEIKEMIQKKKIDNKIDSFIKSFSEL